MPSWSKGCADPGIPAVYTRISYFVDWIGDVMNDTYSGKTDCYVTVCYKLLTIAVDSKRVKTTNVTPRHKDG